MIEVNAAPSGTIPGTSDETAQRLSRLETMIEKMSVVVAEGFRESNRRAERFEQQIQGFIDEIRANREERAKIWEEKLDTGLDSKIEKSQEQAKTEPENKERGTDLEDTDEAILENPMELGEAFDTEVGEVESEGEKTHGLKVVSEVKQDHEEVRNDAGELQGKLVLNDVAEKEDLESLGTKTVRTNGGPGGQEIKYSFLREVLVQRNTRKKSRTAWKPGIGASQKLTTFGLNKLRTQLVSVRPRKRIRRRRRTDAVKWRRPPGRIRIKEVGSLQVRPRLYPDLRRIPLDQEDVSRPPILGGHDGMHPRRYPDQRRIPLDPEDDLRPPRLGGQGGASEG